MENSPKPNALTALLNDLTKDTFKWLFVFLLSVGLVGGASYLLFDAPAKINATKRVQSDIRFKQAEGQAALAMLKISTDGWFSSAANVQTVYDAHTELKNAIPRGTLSAELQRDFPAWADKALISLSGERGLVSGYNFSESYYKLQQEGLLKFYAETIDYIVLEKNTIQDWQFDPPEKRSANTRAIFAAQLRFVEAVSAQAIIVGQSRQIEKVVSDLNQAIDENATEHTAITVRSYFALTGIITGLVIIAILALSFLVSLRNNALAQRKER
jgi:hypothetical protein